MTRSGFIKIKKKKKRKVACLRHPGFGMDLPFLSSKADPKGFALFLPGSRDLIAEIVPQHEESRGPLANG